MSVGITSVSVIFRFGVNDATSVRECWMDLAIVQWENFVGQLFASQLILVIDVLAEVEICRLSRF